MSSKTSKTSTKLSKTLSVDKKSTMSENNNLDEMFEFFAQIVKLKILKNDDMDVVFKYSSWLDALRKHRDADLKYGYVKLLVMGLEHPVPVCPFNAYPPAEIEPIDGEWLAKARDVFSFGSPSCRPAVLNPPVATSVSDDKRQFAAYQTIPGAGLQCYYAQSDEPLHEWFFKYDSASKQPENAVQAIPLDWERSLAGIRRASGCVAPPVRTINLSTPQKSSGLSLSYTETNLAEQPDHCKILETDQENLEIEEGFVWNDKSLLTGDTIPGSDCCIDWLIHEHEKTQLEIDEEMVRVFDKLYPDNFRLSVNPELLEGIIGKLEFAAGEKASAADPIDMTDCSEVFRAQAKGRQLAGNDLDFPTTVANWFSEDSLFTASTELCGGRPLQSSSLSASTYASEPRDDQAIVVVSSPEKRDELSIPSPQQTFATKRPEPDDEQPVVRRSEEYDGLPRFEKVAKSFCSLADEAEKTMQEVSEWLNSKDRKY